MNILSIAYPFAPVNKDTSGGAEQILLQIDSALVQHGYNSFVIASHKSHISGHLLESPEYDQVIDETILEDAYVNYRKIISKALNKFNIDLIHFHGLDFHNYLPETQIPVLVTLHLPLSWYNIDYIMNTGKNIFYSCVSKNQYNFCPSNINAAGYIENGIDVNKFSITKRKKNYALCLGRICYEKGFHLAINAANFAGIPLIIAGEVFPYEFHKKYFGESIYPALNRKIQYFGAADFHQKKILLSEAKCLLIPSIAPETSSLVAMEALASGTPVIAFKSGALPEIVENDVTGYLVDNDWEMSQKINECSSIQSEICRINAIERFSSQRMVNEYINLYKQLVKQSISSSEIISKY